MTQITATDLRIKLRDIVEAVRWRGAVYQVTNFGTPVAILVPVEEYGRLTGATPTKADAEPISVPRGMNLVPEEAEG